MTTNPVTIGLSADDVAEREAGGLLHRALILTDAAGALEALVAEFEYDDSDRARDVVIQARALGDALEGLSLAEDGTITPNRLCSRCSGIGRTSGEDSCVNCGGRGYVPTK